MSEKINLEEIILKHLKYDDSLDGFKEAMLNFGKQLLELASQNAEVENLYKGKSYEIRSSFWNDEDDQYIVHKQSILDTIKQVE